ncbi:hypothetical protein [Morganella psychrotolerans]|uniref:hypothetical protein n=1 Tax=Morganella psychrotolerans TaxID=368603 RepID=UPI0039AFC7A7
MKELASNEMNAVSGGCCGLIAVGTVAAVVLGARVIKPALEYGSPGDAPGSVAGKITGIFNVISGKTTA